MIGNSPLVYVSITKPCFDAVEKVLEAFADSFRTQGEIDEELTILRGVWEAEKERKARTPQQVQEDAKAKGSKPGRRAIDLPSGESLRERLKTIGIGKLAKELGCSAPTIRKRIYQGIVERAKEELRRTGSEALGGRY